MNVKQMQSIRELRMIRTSTLRQLHAHAVSEGTSLVHFSEQADSL